MTMLLGVSGDAALPAVLGLRFLLFSFLYGLEKCDNFFTVVILYIELILSKYEVKMRWMLPIFVLTIFLSKYVYIPSTLPEDVLNRSNILTRIYVLTYLTIRVVLSKYRTMKKEEKLSEQANELRRMEDDEIKFMKRFSHFSRTSLNGIVNFLAFLRSTFDRFSATEKRFSHFSRNPQPEEEELEHENCVDAKISSCLDTVETSSSEIFRQCTELVEFYEIRNGAFMKNSSSSQKEIVEVDEVIEYVVRVQKKLRLDLDVRKKKNVKLILKNSSSNDQSDSENRRNYPRYIRYDRNQLSKVLTNIMSNAIKYTEVGSVTLTVGEKKGEDGRPVLVFVVEDTGIGIEKDILDRIFQPFVRNETGKQSFSVGLVITKSIVERAGGTIEIVSEVGKGTKITVCLPCEVPEEEEIERFVDESVFLSGNEEQFKRLPSQRRNSVHLGFDVFAGLTDVLIVEDKKINQKVFEKLVQIIVNESRPFADDVRIHIANDGNEALSLLPSLANRNPLVLTDIDMPRCDGIEFCKRLRERTVFGETLAVVYAVTATMIGCEKDFCEKHQFDGVASKPVLFCKMKNILRFMALERKKKIERSEKRRNLEEKNISILGERIRGSKRISCDKNRHITSQTKSKVCIKAEGDERERITINIIDTVIFIVFPSAAYFQQFSPICEKHAWGWWLQIKFHFWASVVQYVLLFIFKLSAETNAMLSMIKLFICMIISAELSFFKDVPVAFVIEFSFILQANESLECFISAFVVSFAFLFKCIFYEMTRPSDYISTYQQYPFLEAVAKVGLVFFMVSVINLSYQFVSGREERRRRWMKAIKDMLQIERDYNLTTSKVSHDLATPASALVLYLDEVKDFLRSKGLLREYNINSEIDHNYIQVKNKKFRDQVFKYFRLIIGCSYELELSIHNFLACCKIRNGMVVNKLIPNVHFASFVQSTVDRCKILLIKKDRTIKFTLKMDEKLRTRTKNGVQDKTLCVDMTNIGLIMKNLLLNAIVHSKATEIIFSCFIISTYNEPEEGGTIEIKIEDNGKGVPKKHIEVFEKEVDEKGKFRFKERFSNTLGLGFVVCKYLSKVMEEPTEIKIQSTCSKEEGDESSGTTIRFRFPFKVYEDSKPEEECEGEEEQEGKSVASNSNNNIDIHTILRTKNKEEIRILCVDDDVIIGNFYRMFLTKMGFSRGKIMVLNHEKDAISTLAEKKFDVLISDYNLVSSKFTDLIVQIPEESMPTLVFCATGSPEDLYKDVKGMKFTHAVISKPLTFDSLRNSLRRFMDV